MDPRSDITRDLALSLIENMERDIAEAKRHYEERLASLESRLEQARRLLGVATKGAP